MVNDNHSRLGQKYIERWIMPSFLKAVNDYPIVALTGARQVGKSTFLKNTPRLKDWPYITLDDYDVLEAAKNDPGSLLAGKSRLIIDEIQKAPKLFNELKMAVDKNRKNRFIISGSANLLLSEKISESLAGRAVYHLLIPFAFREANNKGQGKILDLLFKDKRPLTLKHDISLKPSSSLENIILKGFYPPVITGPKALSFALGWLEGFV